MLPKEVRGLTFTNIVDLASEVISKTYIEGYRNIEYPAMGGKGSKKFIKNQRKQVQQLAEKTWNKMFPKRKTSGKSQEQKELEKRYGVEFEDNQV